MLVEAPSPSEFKKTKSGYSYYDTDSDVTCNFKGSEPSPKGFGLCARMVDEGDRSTGTDGNVWIKKGSRWVKDNAVVASKSPKKASLPIPIKYSSMMEWRKKSSISKRFNKMKHDYNNVSEYEWDYELSYMYHSEEREMEKMFGVLNSNEIRNNLPDYIGPWEHSVLEKEKEKGKKKAVTKSKKTPPKVTKTPVAKSKKTKSEALKIHDEVYKTWEKVAKKSKKMYDDEERVIPHPDGLAWGYGTYQKYLDWETCVANSRPKKECNKIITLLKQDLTKMNKALTKVDKAILKSKKTPTKVKKTTVAKSKKKTKSEALKIHDEVYKTWEKVAKKSKKMYDDEERVIPHPDGLAWGYGTYQKYLDWETCVANSRPKKECNKIITLLKQDLTKMNKALTKVDKAILKSKKTPTKVKKTTVAKSKKTHIEPSIEWTKHTMYQ